MDGTTYAFPAIAAQGSVCLSSKAVGTSAKTVWPTATAVAATSVEDQVTMRTSVINVACKWWNE